MTAALTPDLALRYLGELDPAISTVAVMALDGAVLAGDRALAARVAAGAGGEGRLLVARSARHVVAAVVPPGALAGLVEHDLDVVARELDAV